MSYWTTRFLVSIITNLQVSVDNLHLRYEDEWSIPNKPFCFGLLLKSCYCYNVDENWNRISYSNSSLIQKHLTLKNLIVYNDSQLICQKWSLQTEQCSVSRILASLQEKINDNCVLAPLDLDLKVVWNQNELKDGKFHVAVKLFTDHVNIELNEEHYQQLFTLFHLPDIYYRKIKYFHLRPKRTPREQPREWWIYSGTVVLFELRRNRSAFSWTAFNERRHQKQTYISLYKKMRLGVLTLTEQHSLTQLEMILPYSDIVFFRSLAEREMSHIPVERISNKKESILYKLKMWITKFFQRDKESSKFVKTKTESVNETPHLEVSTFHLPKWLTMNFNILIGFLSLSFTIQNQKFIQLSLKNISTDFDIRQSSLNVMLNLSTLQMNDCTTENTTLCRVLYPVNNRQHFLTVNIIIQSQNDRPEYRIYAISQPINLIYNIQFVERLLSFIFHPFQTCEFLYSNEVESTYSISNFLLRYSLTNRRKLDLYLNLAVPNILLPICNEIGDILIFVLTFGNIHVRTLTSNERSISNQHVGLNDVLSQDQHHRENIHQYYETYVVTISNVRMFLVNTVEETHFRSDETIKVDQDILNPFKIDMIWRICKFNSPTLTKIIFDGHLPPILFCISSRQIKAIKQMISQLVTQCLSISEKMIQMKRLHPSDTLATAVLMALNFRDRLCSVEGVVLEGKLFTPEVSFLFTRPTITQEIAKLSLSGVSIEMKVADEEFTLVSLANDLNVEDLVERSENVALRYLLSSKKQSDTRPGEQTPTRTPKDIVQMKWTTIFSNSSRYKGIVNTFEMIFESLFVVFNRKTIALICNELQFIYYEPTSKSEEIRGRWTKLVKLVRQKTLKERPHSQYSSIFSSSRKTTFRPKLEKIYFQFNLIVKSVDVLLNEKSTPLATLKFTNFRGDLSVKQEGVFMQSSLESIKVKDLIADAKFRNVLEVHDAQVFEVKFSITNCEDFLDVETEYKFGLKIRSVRILWNQRFVDELLAYNSIFQNVLEVTAVAIAERLQHIYRDSTKLLRFSIELEDPIVVFPDLTKHSVSEVQQMTQVIMISKLQRFIAQNDFVRSKVHNKKEEIVVVVQSLSLFTAHSYGAELYPSVVPNQNDVFSLVENVNFDVVFERSLAPFQNDPHDFTLNIQIVIPKLEIKISPYQIDTILNICYTNFLYLPSFRLLKIKKRTLAIKRIQDRFIAKKLSDLNILEWEMVLVKLEVPLFVIFLTEHQNASLCQSPNFIMSLGVNCFEMDIHCTLHSDFKIECRLESLNCFDLLQRRVGRETAPPFRHFLGPVSKILSHHHRIISDYQLLGTITLSSNGQTELKFILNGLKLVPIPDTLTKLKEDYESIIENFVRVFEHYKRLNELQNPFEEIDQSQSHERELPMKTSIQRASASTVEMELNLSRIQIYFVEDYTNSTSRSYLLQCNFLIDVVTQVEKTKITVESKDTKIIKIHPEIEKNIPETIIEPFSWQTEFFVLNREMEIFSILRPINMMLTSSDVKVILSIAKQWSETRKNVKLHSEESKEKKTTFFTTAHFNENQTDVHTFHNVSFSMHDDDTLTEDIAFKQTLFRQYPSINKTQKVLQKRIQHITIRHHDMQILLIDDMSDIVQPFVRIFVKEWALEVINSIQIQVLFSMHLTADYYNNIEAIWEPFLEPWSFQLKTIDNTTHIWSNEVMNINLSWSLLSLLKTFIDNWRKVEEEFKEHSNTIKHVQLDTPHALHSSLLSLQIESKVDIEKFNVHIPKLQESLQVEYYIRNTTGVPLYYWLPGQEPQLLYNCQQEVLLTCPSTEIHQRFIKTPETSPRYLLSVEIGGYGVLETLPISNTGTFVVYKHKRKFIYQVKYFRGSKIVIFTSPVLVHNAVHCAIEILLSRHDIDHDILTIESNQILAIPLPYVFEESYLQMRPSGLSYQWSRERISIIDVSARIERLVCPPFVTEQNPFTFAIGVNTDHTMKLKDQHLIRVKPPLVLENLLARSLQYRFFDHNGTIFNTGTLHKGESVAVHTLPLQTSVLLSIKLSGYDWSKCVVVTSNHNNAHYITLRDYQLRHLHIKINNHVDSDGCRKIILYCAYWILNRTGLSLCFGWNKNSQTKRIREDAEIFGEGEDQATLFSDQPREWKSETSYQKEPLMLSFHPNSQKHILFVKVNDSDWSEGLELRNIPPEGSYIEIVDRTHPKKKQRRYELCITPQTGRGKFGRIKIITLSPRFVLINGTNKTLLLNQLGDDGVYLIEPSQRIPFHWPNSNAEKLLRVKLRSGQCVWSGAFSLSELGQFSVQLRDEVSPRLYFLRLRFEIAYGIYLIKVTEELSEPLFQIENYLPDGILVQQKDVDRWIILLKPYKKMFWGWIEPLMSHNIQFTFPDSTKVNVPLEKIKDYKPFHYQDQTGITKLARVRVEAVGMTRVVKLLPETDFKSFCSQPKLFDEKTKYILKLQGVGISVINEVPQELLYITLDGLRAEWVDFALEQSFELDIVDCQIDNQLYTTFNPVVLHSKTSHPPQFLKLTAIRDKTYSNMLYLHYFSLLMRECWICCDEELLLKLLSLSDLLMDNFKDREKTEYEDINPLELVDDKTTHDLMIYNSLFLLNPIQLNVTFIPRKGSKEDIRKSEATQLFLRLPEEMLPEIGNAPLRLHGLLLQNSFTTRSELLSKLQARYKSQLTRQLFVLIGSFNVLGNPVNFVQNLGTGVRDFFFEPAKGIEITRKDFGKRLGKAAPLMAKKSLFAFFDVASKVTKNLGNGVAALTLDKSYQTQRAGETLGHIPQNFVKGLQYGAQSLVQNVKKGITGLIEQPRKGAKAEGTKGAIKGVAKALAGVIIKPTVGCLDLISQTTEGIKNVTKLEFVIERRRPPRYFGPKHHNITTYSLCEARGQELLYSLRTKEGYVNRKQTYWYHVEWPESNRFLVVSDKRIYYSNKSNVEWEIKWKDIVAMQVQTHLQPPRIVILVQLPRVQMTRIVCCIHSRQTEEVFNTLRQLWKQWKVSHGETESSKERSY